MDWRIGEFGKYQQDFIRIRDKQDKKTVKKLHLDCNSTEEGRTYVMRFIMRDPPKETKHIFTVIIEPNSDQSDETKKSITHRVATINREDYALDVHYDKLTADEMCAKWLAEVLLRKNIVYDEARITLPPKLDSISEYYGKQYINRLYITVAEDEKDTKIVQWWLKRFREPINYVKITSTETPIDISTSKDLQEAAGVELVGRSDLDVQFIKRLQGRFFIHRGHNYMYSLNEHALRDLCQHCNLIDRKKAIFLSQGVPTGRPDIDEFLRKEYDDFDNKVSFYRRKVRAKHYFVFRETKSRTVIGNFKRKNDTEMDPSKWVDTLLPKKKGPLLEFICFIYNLF